MEIPREISDQTVQAVKEELAEMLERIGKGRDTLFKRILISELPEYYKPIGNNDSTIVLPVKKGAGYPLCFKLAVSSGKIKEYDRKFDIPNYVGLREIEDNRRALAMLNLEVVVPPQKFIEPIESYRGLLVPDLSCKRANTVTDLSNVEGWDETDSLFPSYQDVMEKLDLLDIKFIGHTKKRSRDASLENCVKHMLFLIEGEDRRFLAVGDINHFIINYGRCSNCEKEGPMLRPLDSN